MYSSIFIQFWMKSISKLIAIAYSHNFLIYFCQYLYILSSFGYIRSPDEGHWYFTDSFDFGYRMKAAKLPALGVSLYCDRKGSKMRGFLTFDGRCQKNHSGTGGQYRHPFLNAFL